MPANISASQEERQMELWNQWRDTDDEFVMGELLDSLTPLLKSNIARYSQYPIPYNVLLHRAMTLTRDALSKYDPLKSKMNTFIVNQLQPIDRFVKQYQNVAYLPEFLSKEFGRFEAEHQALSDVLGRAPTIEEMADHLRIPVKHVERIQAAKAQTSLMSSMGAEFEDVSTDTYQQKANDALAYLRKELNGPELRAFNVLSSPSGGRMSAEQVATKVGVDTQQIYAWRRRWTRMLHGLM